MSQVKESKEFVAMIVAATKGIEAAKAEKFSLASVLTQLIAATPAVIAGVQGVGQMDDEIKAIDEAGIKELAGEAMLLIPDASEKTKTIVEQSVVILVAGMKIFKA
jgi:hypothetical protein